MNVEAVPLDPDQTASQSDIAWLNRVGSTLLTEYPGYPWQVGPDPRGGVINIALALPDSNGQMGNRYGVMIRMRDYTDTLCKRLAGELIERWNLPRDRAPADLFKRAAENGLDKSHATWGRRADA